jgi:hypothetical protein
MSAVAGVLLMLGIATLAQSQSVRNSLQDPANAGRCISQYNNIISTYYSSDPTCARLITTALNTTVVSQCPPTNPGSPVHFCMNQNGNQVGRQGTEWKAGALNANGRRHAQAVWGDWGQLLFKTLAGLTACSSVLLLK